MTMTFTDFLKYLYRKPKHIVISSLAHLFSKQLDIANTQKILIIAPHPDDEVFGCGGLIYEARRLGKNVSVIFMSRGEGVRSKVLSESQIIEKRKELTTQALELLGMDNANIYYLKFIDSSFAKTPVSEEKKLYNLITQINPDSIFYPNPIDGSPDHEYASSVVARITKDIPAAKYHFCVWLWHHTPLHKTLKKDFRKSRLFKVDRASKLRASDIYTEAKDANGFPYSGQLPRMFLKAVNGAYELYFQI